MGKGRAVGLYATSEMSDSRASAAGCVRQDSDLEDHVQRPGLGESPQLPQAGGTGGRQVPQEDTSMVSS